MLDASRLHVFTARSNPLRWAAPHRNWQRFARHMLDAGVNLTVVECAYGEEAVPLRHRRRPPYRRARQDPRLEQGKPAEPRHPAHARGAVHRLDRRRRDLPPRRLGRGHGARLAALRRRAAVVGRLRPGAERRAHGASPLVLPAVVPSPAGARDAFRLLAGRWRPLHLSAQRLRLGDDAARPTTGWAGCSSWAAWVPATTTWRWRWSATPRPRCPPAPPTPIGAR